MAWKIETARTDGTNGAALLVVTHAGRKQAQPQTAQMGDPRRLGARPRATGVVSGRATAHPARMYTPDMGLREAYGLPPDPVIEYYKKDVDRTLLREHLKLTPEQRLEKLVAFMRSVEELRTAARRRP